jgi:hypothetical protein
MMRPPGRVGREPEASLVVEFFHGPDKAEISLFDEIQQGKSAVHVPFGYIDDEPEVRLDHEAASLLVSFRDLFGQRLLFLGCEQFGAADLVKVDPDGVTARSVPFGGPA